MRFLLAVLLLLFVNSVLSQPAGYHTYSTIKEYNPFIKCDLCAKLSSEIVEQTDAIRETLPYKRLTEDAILDLFEVICHPEKKQGIWLKQLDIAELDEVQGEEESASSLVNQPVYDEIMTSGLGDDNSYLVLVQKEGFSKCRRECYTLVALCEDMLDQAEENLDLSGRMFKQRLSVEEMTSLVCFSDENDPAPCVSDDDDDDDDGIVHRRPIPFTFDSNPWNEPFFGLDESELELEHLMASMKEAGLSADVLQGSGKGEDHLYYDDSHLFDEDYWRRMMEEEGLSDEEIEEQIEMMHTYMETGELPEDFEFPEESDRDEL